MGASNSSTRHSQKHSARPSSRHSQFPATRVYYNTSRAGSVYSYTTVTHYPGHHPPPHHQPRTSRSRKGSLASFSDMASVSGHRRRMAGTLLDRKSIFLGRYYARQFSQAVLQRLRAHVKAAKGTKTRVRLSTKGLTIGSKNNGLFKTTKSPYEFFPLDDIHEIIVDNELRSLLIVIRGLQDGHLELLTYKMTDESEARIYQETFNEMVVMRGGNRPTSAIHIEGDGPSTTMTRSGMKTSRQHTYGHGQYYNTTPGSNRRVVGGKPNDGYVYRLKAEDGSGTPASRRHQKPRHRSEGDALDEELRRQIEDREFLAAMRRRESTDINDNDEPDGPIKLIFNKDGIIEKHGNASFVRDGEFGSDFGSDRDSGIQSKDHANADVVDSGIGTVRATVSDYRSMSTARSSMDQTDYGHHYGNGYAGGVRTTARSANRNNEREHLVYQGNGQEHKEFTRSYSPAPSHTKAQSEGGWRVKMPWRRRSKSTDSYTQNPQGQKWETASLMVGTKKPMGRINVPPNPGGPPEYIVMYPTLAKQMKARSASRFEL